MNEGDDHAFRSRVHIKSQRMIAQGIMAKLVLRRRKDWRAI